MYRLKLVAGLSLLFVLSGCGVFGGVNLTGNWAGSLVLPGGSLPLTMALTQNGSSVSGTLTFTGQTVAANVSGTLAGANLILTVGAAPFSGTANGTNINTTGTLQAEDGTPVQATLTATKQ